MSNLIDRIIKLRALAKSTNAHEAASAARAADAIIAEHRITEEEIAIANPAMAETPIFDDLPFYETKRIINWKNRLSVILASHYGCVIWNNRTWDNEHAGERRRTISHYRLVGRKSDIEVVRYMFIWLANEVDRLSVSNCKGKGHVIAQSYCEGAVSGIQTQLQESIASMRSAMNAEHSAAIVRIDARAKESMIALHKMVANLKQSKTSTKTHIDPDAFMQGKEDGKNIHLSKALNPNTTNLLNG